MSVDVEQVRALRPSNQVHYFETVGSTMTEATRLAAAGAPHGTAVIANEQTSGLGRRGRTWVSESDIGLYCSVLLRLPLDPSHLPVASLLIGLAAAEAIQKATHLACDLRWPNDVLIGEKKVAGILPQLVEGCVVAGIGVNVNNTAFPDGLRTPATSLLLAAGRQPQSRELLLVKLFEALDSFAELLKGQGIAAILRAFTAASTYVLNRRVIVEENGLRGITAGLDQYGFLMVRGEDGELRRVSSGGVRPDV
jgi:BirA family transcriptional regulator, biotin operon repressor / biotin---[acetyl-CoA-carboxylase] ligase